MTTILLIEDDAHMAVGLAYNLERAGYQVVRAADGPGGLAAAREHAPDLVLLDIMLPGLHGFDLLARLRREGLRMPVIVLSAKADEVDKIRGFDAGADDYVAKPFSVGELMARIRARLGRAREATSLRLGDGVVSLADMQYRRGRSAVRLTATEVAILRLLAGHDGRPVRREEMLKELWGLTRNTTRTLDTHVNRLRKKIEHDPTAPRHLLTVHGIGYQLRP